MTGPLRYIGQVLVWMLLPLPYIEIHGQVLVWMLLPLPYIEIHRASAGVDVIATTIH